MIKVNDIPYVVGIITAGEGCAEEDGVYGTVSEHLDWILKTMDENEPEREECIPTLKQRSSRTNGKEFIFRQAEKRLAKSLYGIVRYLIQTLMEWLWRI